MLNFFESSRLQKGLCLQVYSFLLAAIALFNPFADSADFEDVGLLLVWAAISGIYPGLQAIIRTRKKFCSLECIDYAFVWYCMINAELLVSNAIYVFAILLFSFDALRQLYVFSQE
jgi:hypothetical protein